MLAIRFQIGIIYFDFVDTTDVLTFLIKDVDLKYSNQIPFTEFKYDTGVSYYYRNINNKQIVSANGVYYFGYKQLSSTSGVYGVFLTSDDSLFA